MELRIESAMFEHLRQVVMVNDAESRTRDEGPKHRKWRELYRESLAKKLRDAGFDEREVERVREHFWFCVAPHYGPFGWFIPYRIRVILCMLGFIAAWLSRLVEIRNLMLKEYEEEGDPPPWDE